MFLEKSQIWLLFRKRLPGNDRESEGAHDDPLAIEHLGEKFRKGEKEDGGLKTVNETEEDVEEIMGMNNFRKRTLMRNQALPSSFSTSGLQQSGGQRQDMELFSTRPLMATAFE